MAEATIPTDGYAAEIRAARMQVLARQQGEYKAMTVIGPKLSPKVYAALEIAQAAVMDLEEAIADEGIREMVR